MADLCSLTQECILFIDINQGRSKNMATLQQQGLIAM
jgi:hypothetical protein